MFEFDDTLLGWDVIDGTRLPTTVVYARVRDDSIEGPNPFKWDLKHSSDYFAGRRVVFFALPGAYTPTCSTYQVPTFEAKFDEFKELGIDGIICSSVNDAFVMYNWAKDQGVKNIEMMPDGNGDFADAMGMLIDKSHLGFGKRSWRYAMVVNDGVVEKMFIEPGLNNSGKDADPYGESSPETILEWLKSIK